MRPFRQDKEDKNYLLYPEIDVETLKERNTLANNVYLRTAALGFVAGLRSMTPFALLNWSAEQHGEDTTSSFFNSAGARVLTGLAAVGEMVADKLPTAPSRISPGPFVARLVFGGVAGMLLCRRDRQSLVVGALLGVIGAGLGTLAGYYARTTLDKKTKVPDFVWGLAEDTLTQSLGMFAVRE
ncbi:MAG: hypothetical protein M3Z24_02055 [Chloroflexota bacterium]|nr:hypothetical protein [Chloroflexota bacterium]